MADESNRWDLPFIVSGQAQKEVTHNEALARIDALLHPVVEAVGLVAPPVAPLPGQGWIIGAGATGDWSGHDGALALSSENGWHLYCAARGYDGVRPRDRAQRAARCGKLERWRSECAAASNRWRWCDRHPTTGNRAAKRWRLHRSRGSNRHQRYCDDFARAWIDCALAYASLHRATGSIDPVVRRL